jgi:hypothetical protein
MNQNRSNFTYVEHSQDIISKIKTTTLSFRQTIQVIDTIHPTGYAKKSI